MTYDFDIDAMRTRLTEALDHKKLSMREVSERAGMNKGYVHSITRDGREPSIGKLSRVCAAADLSLSYILYGFEMSPETERLIALLEANPDKRDNLLSLLQ